MGRKIEIIVLIVLIVVTYYFYLKAKKQAELEAESKQNQNANETKFLLTVKIDGMMCGKCAARVTENLSKFGLVEINLEEKTATITSDELVDIVEVENIVNELGYKFEGIVE